MPKDRSAHLSRLVSFAQRLVPVFALWPAWLLGEAAMTRVPTFTFMSTPASQPDSATLSLLDRGTRWIVFVAGSLGLTDSWAQTFIPACIAACKALGYDGLVLGATASPEPERLADRVFSVGYVPIDAVLRRTSALVHHAGIGTAASAIRHGVPQVLVPRAFSQPSNAEWLRRLGLGVVIKQFTSR